jgi:hypothetical protein
VSASVAEMVLRAFAESGLSRVAFAAQHGIHEPRLHQWQHRLESVNGEEETPVVFRELPAPATLDAARPFELVLPSGMIVRISATFEHDGAGQLLQVLRHAG